MAQGLYLSQKMALQQVLAPQLQQSLAILQAPTLELETLVEQELQQNPLLEEVPETERVKDHENEANLDPAEPPAELSFDPATEKTNGEPVDDFQSEVDKLLQLDQEWRDYFSQTNVPGRSHHSPEDEEKRQFMFDSLTVEPSLQEDLMEQLRLSDLSEEKRPYAELLIGNIDDRGYLRGSISELAFAQNLNPFLLEEGLKYLQTFDPPGVGARDLRECLMLQLERQNKRDTLEYRILDQHMELLGKRRFPDIARQTGVTVQEVQEAAARIAMLEFNPGRNFSSTTEQYISPEVFVHKEGGEYVVSMNNDHQPHLRISNTYKDLIARAETSSEVREYIRDKIRAGKFLIKSLHQRQDTILNIAREIVKRQKDFLDHGVTHLRPMTMAQIAEVVGVHETTVSRAVSGKYMDTPQGLVEMRFFFTSGVQTANGEGMSNTGVKDIINEMVKNEDPAKPLSDDKIVQKLKERNIVIARRTVAKYRTELNILPSHLRKRY